VTASAIGFLVSQTPGRRPARLRERASGRSLCGVVRQPPYSELPRMQARSLPWLIATLIAVQPAVAAHAQARCGLTAADTAGWVVHSLPRHHIGLALPRAFVPDTSVLAALATYHGGNQLTDGSRVVYFSGYSETDIRLQGMWPHPPRRQTPGWPTIAPGWTTTILTDTTETTLNLTAWFVGPRPADRVRVTASGSLDGGYSLMETIACTVRIVAE
jgi:hypothetical protein